jgi:thiamine kinase-like enzyme
MLGQVAATLRRLHAGPSVHATFSAFGIVETYRDNARWLGVTLPEAFHWSWERAEEMRAALEASPPEPCLCHNDLLNANFLLEHGRLLIVDWEYSGMGDPYFDLANFSTNHDLSEDDDRTLLRAYLGRVRERDFARVRLLRIMSDFREASGVSCSRACARPTPTTSSTPTGSSPASASAHPTSATEAGSSSLPVDRSIPLVRGLRP